MWLTLLLRNWYWILIISLTCVVGALTLHGRALKAERDLKIAEIQALREEAIIYQENSARIAKEIKDAYAELLIKTETNAFENAKRRFGKVVGCPVRSLTSDRMLPPSTDDSGKARSTEGTNESSDEQLAVSRTFIEGCGFDAGTVVMWQDWARRNSLPISKD